MPRPQTMPPQEAGPVNPQGGYGDAMEVIEEHNKGTEASIPSTSDYSQGVEEKGLDDREQNPPKEYQDGSYGAEYNATRETDKDTEQVQHLV